MTHHEIRRVLPHWAAGAYMGDVEPLLAHLATGCGECLRDAFPGTPPPLDHVRPRTTTTAARGRLVVSGALASATLVALATSGFVHLQRSRAAPRAGLTQTLSRIDALETDKRRLADRLGEAARELTTLRTAPPAERPAVIEPPPAPAAAAEPEDPTPIVRYDDDRLSVRLVDVPPMRILEELARGTDAVVRGRVAEAPPVSARFDDVPLPEALHRLLGRQNFTLAYDGRHRLRAVTLLGGPVETTRDEQADVGSVDAAAERPAADLSRVLNWRLSVPAHGRLAWTLGVRAMTVGELARASVETGDPRARVEAIHLVLSALEEHEELRTATRDALAKIDDQSLTRAAAALGEHAPEMVARVARGVGDDALRTRAEAVLAALRGGGVRAAADAPAADGAY